ncbi:HNH endonuclease [Mycobacterium sp. PS03-16]|uniref:HNH endonuclease signature motif containing protein n=1 Tax=Mycobacterium sp. PS03-16 TaxID=2559611 RepID=UPI001074364D|nr:HNH endonuclease signature motif containing protein [Mycobacterium sp. PS03-16]TFV60624.1 HNH endonuclease [Mycobacterium sp. PS03-16]
MFEDLDDAAVVAVIEAQARAEAVAGAARLAAIAELAARRGVNDDEEARRKWVVDPWAATAAEVGAVLGIGPRAASREMRIGLALREHLPAVARLYAAGEVSSRVVSMVTWRTRLVDDAAVWAGIDAAVAEKVAGWGRLSASRLERAVDAVIERFDPVAVVRAQIAARDRDVVVGASGDAAVTTSVWGRLLASDAELLRRRLAVMAGGVCDSDPRTAKQRRADALGALAAGSWVLACQCGLTDCPAAKRDDAAAQNVVVHILANHAALAAAQADAAKAKAAQAKERSATAPQSNSSPPAPGSAISAGAALSGDGPYSVAGAMCPDGVAMMIGGGVVPTPLLAALLARGAKVVEITRPGEEPEPQYRPSAKLARFVRMRDMTCRFPGCDRPAQYADLDHTIAYPDGPTHPSNLDAKCREHHLLKTFWTGENGWSVAQAPDGTVSWTTPTGRKITTKPGSALHFPECDTTTAALGPPPEHVRTPGPQRALKMPTRRRTRAAARTNRIRAERARNHAYLTQRERPPPTG